MDAYPLRNIPDDLWHRLKVRAMIDQISVRDIVLAGPRRYAADGLGPSATRGHARRQGTTGGKVTTMRAAPMLTGGRARDAMATRCARSTGVAGHRHLVFHRARGLGIGRSGHADRGGRAGRALCRTESDRRDGADRPDVLPLRRPR